MKEKTKEKMRKRYAENLEWLGEYDALSKMFDETPNLFRKWVQADKEWLLAQDIGTVNDGDRVVAVYPIDSHDYLILYSDYNGRVCTSCACICEKKELVDMERKYIDDRLPVYDGNELNRIVNDAREFAGERWCQDCVEYYYYNNDMAD